MTRWIFRALLAALCAGLLYLGLCLNRPDFMLWGAYCALAGNIIYAFPDRPVFLLFQIPFFLILLAKPGVSALKGVEWWPVGTAFSITPFIAISISLWAAQIGDLLFNHSIGRIDGGRGRQGVLSHFVERVSLIFLLIAFLCSVARVYFRCPILDQFSTLIGAFFCIHAATRPCTGKTYLAIGLYLIPAIPGLFGASEYTFTLRLLLCTGYLLIRRYPLWQGASLLIALPLILWGANLLRTGAGFSFDSLSQNFEGYIAQMGQGFDAFVRAMPEKMTGGSRIVHALFAALSPEALLGTLSGESISSVSGLGPFLSDCYSDWGYVGVTIYSMSVGFCLGAVEWIGDRYYLGFAFLLMVLSGLLALPGSTVLAPVEFLLNPMFYIALLLCLLSALLCRAFSGASRRRS